MAAAWKRTSDATKKVVKVTTGGAYYWGLLATACIILMVVEEGKERSTKTRSTYVPKKKRNKYYQRVNRMGWQVLGAIWTAIERAVESLETKVERGTRARRARTKGYRRRKYVTVRAATTLLMIAAATSDINMQRQEGEGCQAQLPLYTMPHIAMSAKAGQ